MFAQQQMAEQGMSKMSCLYETLGSQCLPDLARMHAPPQFFLGTTRLQLEHKGDAGHVVTNIANVVPAFGFIGIPVIGWLLDSKGYGVTLATINFLGVIASIFQAMPSLYFQVSLYPTLAPLYAGPPS